MQAGRRLRGSAPISLIRLSPMPDFRLCRGGELLPALRLVLGSAGAEVASVNHGILAQVLRVSPPSPMPSHLVPFTVAGVPCIGLNGGPAFKHNEAFSFQIATDDKNETDRYWNAIVGNGGQESECGWCKDKWGVS